MTGAALPDQTPYDGYLTEAFRVNRALRPREIGLRLAVGPWQALDAKTIAVPVVTEMEHHPRPDFTLSRKGLEFERVKSRKDDKHEEVDPLAVTR